MKRTQIYSLRYINIILTLDTNEKHSIPRWRRQWWWFRSIHIHKYIRYINTCAKSIYLMIIILYSICVGISILFAYVCYCKYNGNKEELIDSTFKLFSSFFIFVLVFIVLDLSFMQIDDHMTLRILVRLQTHRLVVAISLQTTTIRTKYETNVRTKTTNRQYMYV